MIFCSLEVAVNYRELNKSFFEIHLKGTLKNMYKMFSSTVSSFIKNLTVLLIMVMVATTLSSCVGSGKSERETKNKEKAEIYYKMGELKFKEGNYRLAIKDLYKSQKLDPESTSLNNLLGLNYFALRVYDKAEEYFKIALDVDSSYSSARMNLGALYLETGKWDSAILEFDVLLKDVFYPTPELLHNNKGWAYYNKGSQQKAVENYKKAIELNPQYSVAYNNLGLAYEKLKKRKSARSAFKKSVEISPNYVDANYNYGRSLLKRDKKKSRKFLKKVVELSPDSKMGKSAKEYLGFLNKR